MAEAPRLRSTKRYGHGEGLSCCFRQWRASSHCRLLHGYALSFAFEFEAGEPDANGWVVDFGGLRPLREWLHGTFDHTTLVAEDDPELGTFRRLAEARLVELRVLPRVGCEAVAALALEEADRVVRELTGGRARAVSAEVWEHEGNSARATRAR